MASLFEIVQKFGRTPDIDAADTNEEIWDGTGAYPGFLDAATAMTVSSSSTDDVATTGTGAWTVKFFGLDENFEKITQTLSLNGQNAVPIPVDTIRDFRGYVVDAGTGGENAGDIWFGSGTVTTGVPAVKYAGILTGLGQTLMAVYTVPSNATGGAKIVSWYSNVGAVASAFATVALQTREFGEAWRTRRISEIAEGGDPSPIELTTLDGEGNRVGGIDLGAKADIRLRVLTNGVNNSKVSGGFNVELYT